MRIRNVTFGIVLYFLLFQSNASALSEYGKIDVYFNDQILPGETVATPTIKIGEPFNVKINMTVNQEYRVSGQISEIGSGNFEVIEGPSEMNKYSSVILKPNESYTFEWTIKPTEGWAGGSLPINFRYSLVEKGNPEPVLNGGFTVAYCTISNEHYEGKIPISEEQPVSETESSPTSASTPAFTLVGALSVIALVFALFRR
ncbi:sarcinarray family MAST domain-containing protein [Methanosarcina mazei]|uniref:Sarcinarray family MAST domain-containing protein n=4 Tax=Methanosarcina mazei TaxID=2209 RepID=A0A0F8M9N3_METMZ|nr:sarcinarray family MAST domain-containing protein [Methanosarcina mazei]AKB41444.1 hypothetical protein MSMAW_2453 [Methanosarcina mazei WWM610]AKB62364.1 hypothetical protein MSMAP_2379 [Methanosarcina mazei SarPi]AKB71832.1 hypothetical protein MSMAC_1942 [Methanosarcina mazei C16]KKG06374.1 hypothetical protein DU47_01155 [Methanosarcina mazei]KKG07418.1 hypothetical protein DU34_07590 [Methanosarcina mazei]